MRIIGTQHTDSSAVEISIDGQVESFTFYGSPTTYKRIMYEKYLDSDSLHEVEITLKEAKYVRFDAFDIDFDGQVANTLGAGTLAPDKGWRRYDGSYPSFNYVGVGWTTQVSDTYFGGSMHYTQTVAGTKVTFEFTGSKLRFIGVTHPTHSASIVIVIDGVSSTFSQQGVLIPSCLQFEKLDLPWGRHTVEVYSTVTYGVRLDAVDIDENGYFPYDFNPPKTGGILRNRITDMEVGDYIRCGYSATSAAAGKFFGLGIDTFGSEIPRDGTTIPNGYFFFIKVKEGLLVADRVVQYGVSWFVLNNSGYTQGSNFNYSLIPIMANDTSPALNTPANGWFSASGTLSTAYLAWKASDGVDGAWGWLLPNNVKQGWIEYRFYKPVTVKAYSLKSTTNPTSMPSVWRLEGWDGSSWVTLDTRRYSGWLSTEERIYEADNNRPYSRYRINMDRNDGHANYLGIGKLKFMSEPLNTKIKMLTGGIAYMSHYSYPTQTDEGFGMFPADNEWDEVIANSPWDGSMWGYTSGAFDAEWTADTPYSGFTGQPGGFQMDSQGRTVRGRQGDPKNYWSTLGTYTSPSKIGFRPALEYKYI
ncbi:MULTISPECIES: hypothetical protein [Paenibacillus]|uniref:hypothetical protein n=1 Tax=Paenibacillus TaxID=44249 RepID=UPI0011B7169B|nr:MULTISPECIES: hypothetical protein [Paenibacillus]